jgi:hypothetical protein
MTKLSRREFIHASAYALAAVMAAGCTNESESPDPVPPTMAMKTPTVTTASPTVDVRTQTPAPQTSAPFLSLHPFIDAHPEVVFVRRTSVPS